MKIAKFEDILAWQKARELVAICYRAFSNNKDYNFRDQLLRAAISIMNNIAEGFGRKGNKEFRNFLYISKGSSAEIRSMLYSGLDLKYISKAQFDDICGRCIEISRILSGLIKTL